MKSPLDANLRRIMGGNYLAEFARFFESMRPRLSAIGIIFTHTDHVFSYDLCPLKFVAHRERKKCF
jgi:hypothetical protein